MDLYQAAALESYVDMKGSLFFIQIGSNDAEFGDPIKAHIRKGRWRGVMIEPVPYVFERLRQTYASDRIRTICCAIERQSGRRSFYAIRQDDDGSLPDWYDQIGSFHKDVVLKHSDQIPDLEQRIQEIEVDCLSYEQLLSDLRIGKVDLLHVDTEGSDYAIIRQVKLDATGPDFVIFEHRHMRDVERDELLGMFTRSGYRCFVGTSDVACIRRDVLSPLSCLAKVPQTVCRH